MGLPNPFKLEKLTIEVYDDLQRNTKSGELEVMYNPTSYSFKYQNVFKRRPGINRTGAPATFVYAKSKDLNLELLLDGTGVGEFGLLNLLGAGPPTVSERLNEFLSLCFYTDGDLHEPKHLRLQWGDGELKDFDCRVESVDVEFTSFDKDGAPLAAKLTTRFVEDVDPEKQTRKIPFKSPDLTHSRVVKAGDTLPLLCKEIYGSSRHYLTVARANELDDFRALTPGQEIRFPPLSR